MTRQQSVYKHCNILYRAYLYTYDTCGAYEMPVGLVAWFTAVGSSIPERFVSVCVCNLRGFGVVDGAYWR